MNEVQIQQMLYLMKEINNNLIILQHLIGYPISDGMISSIKNCKSVQKDKEKVLKELVRINNKVMQDALN